MIQVFGQNFENSYKWLKAIVNVRKKYKMEANRSKIFEKFS